MSEDIVNNNPKKEFLYALGGVALFLGIVLLIGISGFLRPAGEHITPETIEASAAEEAEATAAPEEAATAETAAAPAAETDAAATSDTAADANATPATDADSAVVSAEAGTATAEGTVNQAAVADVTAEQADADLDAGTTEKAATAE